ncbi:MULTISPECIES: alpha/beta fold hydrolase [unclassified Nocardia]|uniref:alpha/beta fold hydrolase n=1 Tax=unclassified Nocardia TaxID=2637762 RepID=UPI0033A7CD4A
MRSVNQFAMYAVVLLLLGTACAKPTTVAYSPPEFVDGPCPTTPHPVPILDGARCGELIVPADRSEDGGTMLRLAVAVIPSRIQPPTSDPLVFLMGGPGQDGVTNPPIPDDIVMNRDRDLILLSQRGTPSSTPALTCPEIYDFYARRVGLPYDAPTTGEQYVQAVRACRDRLSAHVDLAAFNTHESVYDLMDLRKALGIDTWNVYSHSYGTQLALSYLANDARAVRSIAFDGVLPNSAVDVSILGTSAREGIDAMIAACAAQPACRERYPDLGATFTRLVGELAANPVTTTVDIPGTGATRVVLDGGALLNWAVSATHFPTEFAAGLDELDHGNPQPIAARWAEIWSNADKAGVLAWGLLLSVVCQEWVPIETPEEQLRQARESFPEFPASVQAHTPQLPFIREACAVWDVPAGRRSARAVVTSDIPALVLSGSFDAQTGARWGAEIAKNFSQSTVVVVPGAAHGLYADPCGAAVIASFFDNPEHPDTRCVEETEPPPFDILPPRP